MKKNNRFKRRTLLLMLFAMFATRSYCQPASRPATLYLGNEEKIDFSVLEEVIIQNTRIRIVTNSDLAEDEINDNGKMIYLRDLTYRERDILLDEGIEGLKEKIISDYSYDEWDDNVGEFKVFTEPEGKELANLAEVYSVPEKISWNDFNNVAIYRNNHETGESFYFPYEDIDKLLDYKRGSLENYWAKFLEKPGASFFEPLGKYEANTSELVREFCSDMNGNLELFPITSMPIGGIPLSSALTDDPESYPENNVAIDDSAMDAKAWVDKRWAEWKAVARSEEMTAALLSSSKVEFETARQIIARCIPILYPNPDLIDAVDWLESTTEDTYIYTKKFHDMLSYIYEIYYPRAIESSRLQTIYEDREFHNAGDEELITINGVPPRRIRINSENQSNAGTGLSSELTAAASCSVDSDDEAKHDPYYDDPVSGSEN